jgi:hypothetical protein
LENVIAQGTRLRLVFSDCHAILYELEPIEYRRTHLYENLALARCS